jgi:L-fucose mutarotase/ribose pyranase (RbsD/FucU family)
MTTRPLLHTLACVFSFLLVSCTKPDKGLNANSWQSDLHHELPRLGHRNFIVIADSAYPLQSAPGIRTVHVGGTQAATLKKVLAMLATQKHVRPTAWIDAEQAKIAEADAPGIDQCRKDLTASLKGVDVRTAPHMEIIKRLDESSKLFNVTILKTDEILPYTSVFLELDCGYWNADKEARLRATMN